MAKVVPLRLAGMCKVVWWYYVELSGLSLFHHQLLPRIRQTMFAIYVLQHPRRKVLLLGVRKRKDEGAGHSRCKEDTRRKSNHNFAAQSCYCGRRGGRNVLEERGGRESFCDGQSWPQRWTQQYRVPSLAFYEAIRTRWCVIMAPYRGKAISACRPVLCPLASSFVLDVRYDMPRIRRFSPLNGTSNIPASSSFSNSVAI